MCASRPVATRGNLDGLARAAIGAGPSHRPQRGDSHGGDGAQLAHRAIRQAADVIVGSRAEAPADERARLAVSDLPPAAAGPQHMTS